MENYTCGPNFTDIVPNTENKSETDKQTKTNMLPLGAWKLGAIQWARSITAVLMP